MLCSKNSGKLSSPCTCDRVVMNSTFELFNSIFNLILKCLYTDVKLTDS